MTARSTRNQRPPPPPTDTAVPEVSMTLEVANSANLRYSTRPGGRLTARSARILKYSCNAVTGTLTSTPASQSASTVSTAAARTVQRFTPSTTSGFTWKPSPHTQLPSTHSPCQPHAGAGHCVAQPITALAVLGPIANNGSFGTPTHLGCVGSSPQVAGSCTRIRSRSSAECSRLRFTSSLRGLVDREWRAR